jgi:hypothetical protein
MQLVWAASTHVGFGFTLSNTMIAGYPYQCTWVVARYVAPGNLIHPKVIAKNVLPPQGEPNFAYV